MSNPCLPALKSALLLFPLLWASSARAQEPQEPGAPSGGKFSLLGRDCEAEPDELETTPGSPPLDVDDPGTPGCNAWEINIVTSGEFGKATSWDAPLFDINYGVGDNVQLKAEIAYQFESADGESQSGFGLGEVGIKYRFYDDESHDRSIAVYPQLEFAVPGTAGADGDEGTGTLTKLPVLMSTRLAETAKGAVMLTANVGYNVSTHPDVEDYVSASLGIGFPLASRVSLMVEGSTEQALRKNAEGVRAGYYKANLGLFARLTPHLMVFGAVGHSFAGSDMDDPHHPFGVLGFRVLAGGP
jgi:hypothetical protein